MKNKGILFIITICFYTASFSAAGRSSVYFESGYTFISYSNISIPRSKTNEFSLKDDLKAENLLTYRTELRYRSDRNYAIELIYAPLSIDAAGTLMTDLEFNGDTFTAGDSVKAVFRFDSYRIRYRYYFKNPKLYLKAIGFTAKIRYAEISVRDAVKSSVKLNTGFVPLINYIFLFPLKERFSLEFSGEALFSPYGRAEDIVLALSYVPAAEWRLKTGYRVVEGGSDVEEVYSFSWINYLIIAAEYRF